MNAQNAMNIFEFEDAPVRTLMIDQEPWFVGKDVCRVLEIQNHWDAIGRLDEDEKGLGTTEGLSKPARGGGEQETLIINESGVYHLAFTSRLDAAKRFRRWVTSEVLPALRKTGRYEMNEKHPGDLTIRDKINMVSEARRSHGRPAARALWAELGLPLTGAVAQSNSATSEHMDAIQEFLSDCTVPDAAGRVRAHHLKRRYDEWARQANAPMMTATAFGLLLPQMGYEKMRTNVVFYKGFRLLTPGECRGEPGDMRAA